MKLPSIIKIPAYQRFNYEPRYYDPVKEDIEERTRRIRRRIEADKKHGLYPSNGRLEGAFMRRVPHEDNASFIRLMVGVTLFSGVVGYLYFGNIAVYIASGLVLAYLVLKKLVRR